MGKSEKKTFYIVNLFIYLISVDFWLFYWYRVTTHLCLQKLINYIILLVDPAFIIHVENDAAWIVYRFLSSYWFLPFYICVFYYFMKKGLFVMFNICHPSLFVIQDARTQECFTLFVYSILSSTTQLTRLHITCEGTIEDQGYGMLQVNSFFIVKLVTNCSSF